MGKVLTMEEIKKQAVQKDMPLGITEAVFEKLEYKEDPKVPGNIVGAFVHFEGYRSIYLPFTDGAINYQLDYLLEQLGVESYDPETIAATKGTCVKVSRYLKESQKPCSEEEFKDLVKKYNGTLPTYIEVLEDEEGIKIKNTFTNTNFNLNTIKE